MTLRLQSIRRESGWQVQSEQRSNPNGGRYGCHVVPAACIFLSPWKKHSFLESDESLPLACAIKGLPVQTGFDGEEKLTHLRIAT